MEDADFSGYATKAGLKCRDGRVITPEAFRHMDGTRVPLVWQHVHNSADNVLGHAILKDVGDGVRAYGYFNDTPNGINAKKLVLHGDIVAMSIYANDLMEKMMSGAKSVLHGVIREVSLVLSGANPGALIDQVRVAHGPDDYTELEDAAIIYTGETIQHRGSESEPEDVNKEDEESSEEEDAVEHAAETTAQDVYDSMTEEQKNVLHYMVGAALEKSAAEHSGIAPEEETTEGENLTHTEGNGEMTQTRNVFDQNKKSPEGAGELRHAVSQEDVRGIIRDSLKKGSLKTAVEDYALAHGITDINLLFPEAKALTNTPEFDKRRTEWVKGVLDRTRKSPFSRVKTLTADLTQDEARAKGYIKGEYKKEEWFGVTRRTTSPTTVYKKQRLDRDDVLDITEFDAIAWLKGEMRLMLEEEIARAILIGDGREVGDTDKIKDPIGQADGTGIRSIVNEHELFATTVTVNVDDANSSYSEVEDVVLTGMEEYKGTGTPTFYCTVKTLNAFLMQRDTTGRRKYSTKTEVAAALGVDSIVTVDVMNEEPTVLGIIVNLQDYNIGTDQGGEVTMFDDFDIDYNQQKYLIETRLSGALVRIKSAVIIRKTASGSDVLATPTVPTFVSATGVVTIPTVTGVTYKNADSGATLSSGAQSAIAAGQTIRVKATANSGYYFKDSQVDGPWSFKRDSA